MKKNFIKKLLIGGLITSICISCCFINVKADTPNLRDDFDDYPENYNIFGVYGTPSGYKGKTLYLTPLHNMSRFFNYIDTQRQTDIYITWENQELINTRYNFSFVKGTISSDRERSLYDLIYCYGFKFSTDYDANGIIYSFSVLNSENQWLKIFETNDGGVSYVNSEYNFDKSMLINFPVSNEYNIVFYSPQINQAMVDAFNFDFGTSYDYEYGVFGIISLFFFDNSIPVIPNHLLNSYEDYRNTEVTRQLLERYEQGYQNGYDQGILDSGGDTSYRFPFLTGVFNAVSDVLSLEIFPNVKLSYFVFVPLTLGITGMIFWFWRKD